MSLHIKLSPEMESFVNSKVASGAYGNAADVVREAVVRMQAEERHSAAWHAAIRLGDEQLDRGEALAYTPTLLKTLTQRALDAMHSGKPLNPDVLP